MSKKPTNHTLVIQGLHKSYIDGEGEELAILRGIDLQFSTTENVAILGRSGSGKSTLLHLIGGLDKANEGKILFDETSILDLKKDELSEFRNLEVGLVFQAHHLLPDFTALENVAIPAIIAGKPEAEAKQKALELLTQMDLLPRAEHKPSELSGGEQQRVAIARALINQPKLLLCDEPTGNLDKQNEEIVANLLLEIAQKQDVLLILVTHNPQLAKRLDRQMELVEGLLHET